MFIRMLKLPPEVRDRRRVEAWRWVYAAAPCPIAVKEQMIGRWGPIIHEHYAGTEGNVSCTATARDGWPMGTKTARPWSAPSIVDEETGERSRSAREGTVYFESAAEFEYHNDPEKTRASRLANGWSTLATWAGLTRTASYLTDRKA